MRTYFVSARHDTDPSKIIAKEIEAPDFEAARRWLEGECTPGFRVTSIVERPDPKDLTILGALLEISVLRRKPFRA